MPGRNRLPTLSVIIALGAFLCAWAYLGSRRQPAQRTISALALSPSGRWLAAGTPQGLITIRAYPSATIVREVGPIEVPLNDLSFSPDERYLAVGARDLTLYPLDSSGTIHRLRDDAKNYGTIRFSPTGRSILTINGASVIEIMDADSGAFSTQDLLLLDLWRSDLQPGR